jgi:hypothetical protein
MLLFYLRTHIPQTLVALLCGGTQSDVSRDLRRLLPLLREVLPTPAIWDLVEEPATAPADALPAAETQESPARERISQTHVLVDATEQEVARPKDSTTRKQYYSGKQKEFTLKTQVVTDADHHIVAISTAVPGTMHDKTLCDSLHTLERLPDGAEVKLDKGYQGVAAQVELVTVRDATTGQEQQVARLHVQTPSKKPRGGECTDEQNAWNRTLNTVRVRAEHCIGWMKNWAILATQFRCRHAIYTSVMHAVCGLVNLQTQRWQEAKQAEAAYCA